MRHRKRRTKLSMMTAHRNAMLRNMVRSLLQHQKIQVTLRRAKEARRLAEHIITLAKNDTVDARRRAYSFLPDRDLVTKLFREIAPLFKNRNSGYTRIVHLGFRRGDGADMAILELTEKKITEKLPKKKKEKAKPEEAAPAVSQEAKPRAAEEGHEEREAGKKVQKKEAPPTKPKAMPKAKPTLEEEKRAEKAKSEDKKVADKRGFMKNLRGLFRKRGDR